MALSETWFLDGYIDFELQKYKLLAYLQEVNKHFHSNRLYPQLSDVIFHYQNLADFKRNKKLLQNQFPKELSSINIEQLELTYKKMLEDDDLMAELEDIVEYAITKMKKTIESGTELYEIIEHQLCIEPVGILPLYKNEGYLLVHFNKQPEVKVFSYAISMLQHDAANYTAVKMEYIDSYQKSISVTYSHIKTELIRNIRALPNPAVYFIESELQVPLNETLLPIAKRALVKYTGTC